MLSASDTDAVIQSSRVRRVFETYRSRDFTERVRLEDATHPTARLRYMLVGDGRGIEHGRVSDRIDLGARPIAEAISKRQQESSERRIRQVSENEVPTIRRDQRSRERVLNVFVS